MAEVKEYTLRAINKYNGKFDRIAVNLPKGSKQWIKENTGKSCNAFFVELFNIYKAEHEKEAEEPPQIEQGAEMLGGIEALPIRTEPAEDETLEPLDISQFPDNFDDFTPEHWEMMNKRIERRKALEPDPEPIPAQQIDYDNLPFK